MAYSFNRGYSYNYWELTPAHRNAVFTARLREFLTRVKAQSQFINWRV